MNKPDDIQLENDFLNLLEEVAPEVASHTDFIQDFANHLASFTEAWATNSEDIEEYEKWLNQWVESNMRVVVKSAEPSGLAAYDDEEGYAEME